MITLGSKINKCRYLCSSLWIMIRHSVWGMEGYKLDTSMATRMASSGMWRSASKSDSAVELWR